MHDKVTETVTAIRNKGDLSPYDEASTKQTVISPILMALGWNIFDRDEVFPEYEVESGKKVDYSLRVGGRNVVFIEAKRPSTDLEGHKPQLWNYAGWQGVQLAVLTNGIGWWFYLPMLPDVEWPNRKFYAIDIKEQSIESIVQRFEELLSKSTVQSGEAIRTAQRIHEDRKRSRIIGTTIPEAWNKIIGDRDTQLLESIADATEKLCGLRPQMEDILTFIDENKDRILVDTHEEYEQTPVTNKAPQHPVPTEPEEDLQTGRGGGPIAVSLGGKEFHGTSVATLYLSVLKYVVDNKSIEKLKMPWGRGTKRYFIFQGDSPTHMNGKQFTDPVSYKHFHLEAHANRAQGLRFLGYLCTELGYKFKVLTS